MPRRPDPRGLLAPFLLVLLGLVFCGSIAWLIDTRVGGGDIYPAYSSLRADPRGSKALFLAIDKLPGRSAHRNLLPWHRLELYGPTTILALGGADAFASMPERERAAMLGWLDAGHRVVLTAPDVPGRSNQAGDLDAEENDEKSDKEIEEDPDKDTNRPITVADPMRGELAEPDLLGMKIGLTQKKPGPARLIESDRFPGGVWRGQRTLKPMDDGRWLIEGTVDGEPVIASRRIGKGEIILVAESGFATNEGVWRDRRSAFLLALIGDNGRVVFDERLLGTYDEPGIMTLVRRLGLQGILIGGMCLLVLLVWQGLCPLVPPDPARDEGTDRHGVTMGRDSVDGLVCLLQRGLTPARLLGDGIERWLRSREGGHAPTAAEIDQARSLASTATPGQLARVYLLVRDHLIRPKHPRPPTTHHGSH